MPRSFELLTAFRSLVQGIEVDLNAALLTRALPALGCGLALVAGCLVLDSRVRRRSPMVRFLDELRLGGSIAGGKTGIARRDLAIAVEELRSLAQDPGRFKVGVGETLAVEELPEWEKSETGKKVQYRDVILHEQLHYLEGVTEPLLVCSELVDFCPDYAGLKPRTVSLFRMMEVKAREWFKKLGVAPSEACRLTSGSLVVGFILTTKQMRAMAAIGESVEFAESVRLTNALAKGEPVLRSGWYPWLRSWLATPGALPRD